MVANPQSPNERPGEALARAEVFLKAMVHMGTAALNVGEHELSLGLPDLHRLANKYKMPLLSANIYASKTKTPEFTRIWVKKFGQFKVGMFGLITSTPPDLSRLFVDQGLEVHDPQEEARAVVKELQAQNCDMIVVLSQMNKHEVGELLEKVPGIHLVLGTNTMELTMQLVAAGTGYFADAFTKGKYIGEVTVQMREKRDRYYAANMRASMETDRADAARQLQSLQIQIESADQKDSGLQLTKETRQIVEQQMVAVRARLQRLTMQLEGVVAAPPNASTLDFSMNAISAEILEDPFVDGLVRKFQEKFAKRESSH